MADSPKTTKTYEVRRAFGAALPAKDGARARSHYFTNDRRSRELLAELPTSKLKELEENGNIAEAQLTPEGQPAARTRGAAGA
jgi:hypothetical protein